MKAHPDRLVLAILRNLRGRAPEAAELLVTLTGVASADRYEAGLVGKFNHHDRWVDAAVFLASKIRTLSHRRGSMGDQLDRVQRQLSPPATTR